MLIGCATVLLDPLQDPYQGQDPLQDPPDCEQFQMPMPTPIPIMMQSSRHRQRQTYSQFKKRKHRSCLQYLWAVAFPFLFFAAYLFMVAALLLIFVGPSILLNVLYSAFEIRQGRIQENRYRLAGVITVGGYYSKFVPNW